MLEAYLHQIRRQWGQNTFWLVQQIIKDDPQYLQLFNRIPNVFRSSINKFPEPMNLL